MTLSQKDIILDKVSQNNRWRLTIYTTPDTPYFRADIVNIDHTVGCCAELRGISFGPYPTVPASDINIRWDLPDNVLGFYVGSDCYGLFRCGAGRRRSRGTFRCPNNPLTNEEIEWFCAKKHIQYRSDNEEVNTAE